jgi:hypothetical protein
LKAKDTYTETAEVLEFRNHLKKEWITEETWKKTEVRRDIRKETANL